MEFSCPQGIPGRFESTNLSRDNLSREIGRTKVTTYPLASQREHAGARDSTTSSAYVTMAIANACETYDTLGAVCCIVAPITCDRTTIRDVTRRGTHRYLCKHVRSYWLRTPQVVVSSCLFPARSTQDAQCFTIGFYLRGKVNGQKQMGARTKLHKNTPLKVGGFWGGRPRSGAA